VVAPDKHDVGGVPLTDKVGSRPYVLLSLLLHGVCSQLLSLLLLLLLLLHGVWSYSSSQLQLCSQR
jgi:hypothetical protein